MTMKALLTFSIALFLSISGCVFQRAQIASRAQSELVGTSKKDLLLCAGHCAKSELMTLSFLRSPEAVTA